jgi:hypothetical protein
MTFETNVFVNCPFDAAYYDLLQPLLFSVVALGFTPRIASEQLDSGEPRIQKIIRLIGESKFAIHDLSRIQAKERGELYRLNMPFELGIDVGCRLFGGGQWSGKSCLILESEPYRYQAAISDLSNSDIASHGNDPYRVVTCVRHWLNRRASETTPGPRRLWGWYNDFTADNYKALKERGFSDPDIDVLPVDELIADMSRWAARNRA